MPSSKITGVDQLINQPNNHHKQSKQTNKHNQSINSYHQHLVTMGRDESFHTTLLDNDYDDHSTHSNSYSIGNHLPQSSSISKSSTINKPSINQSSNDTFSADPEEAHRNSLGSTIISYVCTTVGAGIISLPYALAQSGWIGLAIIPITAIICVQTSNWLIQCMFYRTLLRQSTHHSDDRLDADIIDQTIHHSDLDVDASMRETDLFDVPHLHTTETFDGRLSSYEAVGVACFGRTGKLIVALFQNITLFGVCAIFLIIAAGNLTEMMPRISIHLWVLLLAAMLIPISWLRTIKEVAPLAWFGFAASLLVGGVVVVMGFQQLSVETPVPVERPFVRWGGISTCINVVVFSLGSHSVMPSQVSEMKRASVDYKKFSSGSYLLIASIYSLVAAAGYAGWGTAISDNVLNSLPDTAKVIVIVARTAITLHVIMAYPLPLNPVSLFIESQCAFSKWGGWKERAASMTMRTGLVIGTMLVALFLPYLGSVLSLVSALSIVAVALILPPVFYYKLFRHRGISKLELTKMAIVIIIGIASCVIGLYYAITGLINDVETSPNPFGWL